jgi:hypothetical protein
MRVLGFVAVGLLAGLLAGPVHAQPPTRFVLQQNSPDPFCPETTPGGSTTIQFAMPQSAEVDLVIRSQDGTTVVRTLVHALLQAGYHSVVWDGRDDSAVIVPGGSYPYTMTAREPGGGPVLFEMTLVATVSCPVPHKKTSWGSVKRLFSATAS